MNNTFATSETLRDIQWQQPGKYEIARKLQLILTQYWSSPKLQQIIEESRIPKLADEATELAKLTWDKLAELRLDMIADNRIANFQNELDELLARTPKVIANIMSQDWSQAA